MFRKSAAFPDWQSLWHFWHIWNAPIYGKHERKLTRSFCQRQLRH